MRTNLLQQCVAELIGTFTLIFIGVGSIYNSATGSGVGLFGVALAHGLAIAVMVSATAAISGGHLNPAVSFGVWVGGKMTGRRLVAYGAAQLLGGALAGLFLLKLCGPGGAAVVAQGTPDLGPWVGLSKGILIEAVLTFFLVFVVYGTAVDGRAPKLGGLAIGLTVAMGVLYGGPMTGAAMNPARAFGPALASWHWQHHLVYWIGPLLGGAGAGLIYGRFLIRESD